MQIKAYQQSSRTGLRNAREYCGATAAANVVIWAVSAVIAQYLTLALVHGSRHNYTPTKAHVRSCAMRPSVIVTLASIQFCDIPSTATTVWATVTERIRVQLLI